MAAIAGHMSSKGPIRGVYSIQLYVIMVVSDL